MPRKTAADFDPDLLILFDAYVHGRIDRRGFLNKAQRFAVGGVTAGMLLNMLSPNFAEAQQVAPGDARLRTDRLDYPSPEGSGTMRGYLAVPANASGPLPGIVVIHENRGLNPHIEDVTRRFALENFVAFAPDALAPLGGYPASGEEEARQMFGQLDRNRTNEDMVAAATFLKGRPECTGRIGAVGFCWGGAATNMLATRVPDLAAAVPFYGSPADLDAVERINAPLLIHYAGADDRVNAMWPEYEAALKAAGKTYSMHMYDGAQHGFNNDTTPRYDEAAATLAWQRTVEFFNTHLRA
jgi:carboxymethylenebutenolidase